MFWIDNWSICMHVLHKDITSRRTIWLFRARSNTYVIILIIKCLLQIKAGTARVKHLEQSQNKYCSTGNWVVLQIKNEPFTFPCNYCGILIFKLYCETSVRWSVTHSFISFQSMQKSGNCCWRAWNSGLRRAALHRKCLAAPGKHQLLWTKCDRSRRCEHRMRPGVRKINLSRQKDLLLSLRWVRNFCSTTPPHMLIFKCTGRTASENTSTRATPTGWPAAILTKANRRCCWSTDSAEATILDQCPCSEMVNARC